MLRSCSPGGIGHSLALSFHEAGVRVFATARSASSLTSLSDLGIETLSLQVDSEDSVQECLASIQKLTQSRGLDFLVNNAGRGYTVPALDITLDEVRLTFETNVFAPMRLVQTFSSLLIQAQGTIVMIGSVSCVVPIPFGSVYNSSKAALTQYANTLRIEMAPLGVKVITIVTGGVQSRIARLERALPENSYYKEIDAAYQRRLKYSQEDAMDSKKYADSVVRQVLPGGGTWPWTILYKDARKKWIWEGYKSWLVWTAFGGWTLQWSWLPDFLFTRQFKFDDLRRAFEFKKKKKQQ